MTTGVPEVVKKRIYVGNLAPNVTTEDLTNLFGLGTTPYLRETCSCEIAVCENTGKSKNFAFVTVPEHVNSELMKLNGIEFYGKTLVIEQAKSKAEDGSKNEGRQRRGNNRRGNFRGGRRRYNNQQKKSKFTLPNLEPDQVFSLVDGGVNLTNPKFFQSSDYVIARALAGGVDKMVVTGLKMNGCKSAVIMAKTRPNILYAAVGVHPHFVKDDWTDKSLEQLEELVKLPEVVAVGECGLDFKRDYSPRDAQETAFKKQVELAVRYQKSLLVHERDSHQGILDVLKDFQSSLPPVVIHCFTGTVDEIKAYIERGFYIGVTGYICKGNLGENVGTEDLQQLFGLQATPYLRTECTVEIPKDKETGKLKDYAFVTVPEHILGELMKLNGIEFYGKPIKIEEAKDRKRWRRGKKWGPRKNKFAMPQLEADQIFHLVDGASNLTNPRFRSSSDHVIGRALHSGVQKMVVTGLHMNGCKSAVLMAKTRPNIVYAAAGIHPHYVTDDWTEKNIEELEEMIKLPEVVAVGECGLDFKRDFSPRDKQEAAFKKQVQLAVQHQKALIVHERDSFDAIMDVLKEFQSTLPPVIIHCFTGTPEQIKAYVERGYYIGVTGYVCKETYGESLRQAIKDGTLPLNRIVVETNAPWMTPNVPKEEIDPVSQTLLDHCFVDNEPCTLSVIVRSVAKCLSQEPKAVADVLTETAMKVYRFTKTDGKVSE